MQREAFKLPKRYAAMLLSLSIAPYLFSAAVVGLAFKQLQQGASVGPAEIFAALVCIVLAVASVVSGQKLPRRPLVVASGFVLLVGAAAAFAFFTDPQRLSTRDSLAYIFTFFLVCIFVIASQGREVSYIRAAAITISMVLFLFVLAAIFPSSIQDMMYYQGTSKLQGLSNNPNQIGFLAATGIAFLLVLDLAKKLPTTVLLLASGACGLAGAMSGSTAFTFAVAVTLVLVLLVASASYLRGKGQQIPLVLVLPALLLLLAHTPLLFGVDFPLPVGASSSAGLFDMEADNGQGSARLLLWGNAISAVSESPILGLGPGAHVPMANLATGSTTLNEAHNTVIDLLVVAGALGLLAFSALVCNILWNAYRSKVLMLYLVCIMPIGSFALFHYEGRQPLFWISMYLSAGIIPLLLREEYLAIKART